MSNRVPTLHQPTSDDVEPLLREFFRSEMPDPWPRLDLPRPSRQPARSPWQRSGFRFALAASLLLALGGYLTLASLFPADPAGGLVPHSTIAEKSGHRQGEARPALSPQIERQTTPSGHEAELREFNLPDGRMIIEVIEIPSGRNPR